MTLSELQNDCALAVLPSIGVCGAPLPAVGLVRDADISARQVNDLAVRHFARYVHTKKPQSPRDMDRAERKVRARVDKDLRVGFAPLIGILGSALISWLLGKLFSFLWDWYRGANAQAVASMVGTAYEWGDDDEPDNEDGDSDDADSVSDRG